MSKTRRDLEREVLIGQQSETEQKPKKHRYLANLNKTYSTPRRYASSVFVAFGEVAEILSNHALIMSIALLVAGLLGFAISPPVGIAIVSLMAVVLAVTAVVTFILHSQKINKINQYIAQKEKKCEAIEELEVKVADATLEQQRLLQQARELNLDISDELVTQEAMNQTVEQKTACDKESKKTFVETVQGKISEHTAAMHAKLSQVAKNLNIAKFSSVLREIGHGVLAVGVAVAAAGGIVAGIAAFTGANVFQLGLIAAFTAATGLSGPIGIGIIAIIASVFIGILLVNKFCFKMPVDKAEKSMKQDKLKHELAHAQAEAQLARTEHTNIAILQKINAKLMNERTQFTVCRQAPASPVSAVAIATDFDGMTPTGTEGQTVSRRDAPEAVSPSAAADVGSSSEADASPSSTDTQRVSPDTLRRAYHAFRSRKPEIISPDASASHTHTSWH